MVATVVAMAVELWEAGAKVEVKQGVVLKGVAARAGEAMAEEVTVVVGVEEGAMGAVVRVVEVMVAVAWGEGEMAAAVKEAVEQEVVAMEVVARAEEAMAGEAVAEVASVEEVWEGAV